MMSTITMELGHYSRILHEPTPRIGWGFNEQPTGQGAYVSRINMYSIIL